MQLLWLSSATEKGMISLLWHKHALLLKKEIIPSKGKLHCLNKLVTAWQWFASIFGKWMFLPAYGATEHKDWRGGCPGRSLWGPWGVVCAEPQELLCEGQMGKSEMEASCPRNEVLWFVKESLRTSFSVTATLASAETLFRVSWVGPESMS